MEALEAALANMQRSPEVEAYLKKLDHPRKREILVLRELILRADQSISEGFQGKAPSFRTDDYFATFHLDRNDSVQIFFHLGSKARPGTSKELEIKDPYRLLRWVSNDRAFISFRSLEDVASKLIAVDNLICQWIQYV